MSESNSHYAEQRAAVKRHKTNLNSGVPKRQKLTEKCIADLQQIYGVMRKLYREGCLINHFYSTDAAPVIMVEPCQNFKRFIAGSAVHIDQRIKAGKVVQVFNHVEVKGVWIEWTQLEVKGGKNGG